ncbi:hypothetical protein [Streptomyces spectabilis]|uniref:Uncharacterized protein n=1 Tax=Streptomyces spectabilis TaxID=68270 RepID=A0A7W8F020_STRST|nr:hypothetical protein [Streptomyces spectabilis]MBB5109345.1 hypothetical protein [Streptomyces spectabilis]GGV52531.1 hypothetical protein GCM10010245_82770 [Streptomyces spectabilis]
MSAAAGPRRARYYTSARRHPWVLGRWADWRIPFGPYNAAQIALAVVGGFVLIKLLPVWTAFGPAGGVLVLAGWIAGIWLLRRPRIGGRSPLAAAVGFIALAGQPAGGRIGRRAARDRPARRLGGGCVLEALPRPAPSPPRRTGRSRTAGHRRRRGPSGPGALVGAPVSPVQALLARSRSRSEGVR